MVVLSTDNIFQQQPESQKFDPKQHCGTNGKSVFSNLSEISFAVYLALISTSTARTILSRDGVYSSVLVFVLEHSWVRGRFCPEAPRRPIMNSQAPRVCARAHGRGRTYSDHLRGAESDREDRVQLHRLKTSDTALRCTCIKVRHAWLLDTSRCSRPARARV